MDLYAQKLRLEEALLLEALEGYLLEELVEGGGGYFLVRRRGRTYGGHPASNGGYGIWKGLGVCFFGIYNL
jgi:hypothetical protein